MSVEGNGELPRTGGTISALGEPYAARLSSKEPAMRLDSGCDLRPYGSVRAEQRKISMGRAGSDDLDGARFVKLSEAEDNVAVQVLEAAQRILIELPPERGDTCHVRVTLLSEFVSVFDGGFNFASNVLGKFFFEYRMRELFQQNGSEPHIGFECAALLLQFTQHGKQREISFRRGFMQPLRSVRPGAVIDDVRKVGMERKSNASKLIFSGSFLRHRRTYFPVSKRSGFRCSAAAPEFFSVLQIE